MPTQLPALCLFFFGSRLRNPYSLPWWVIPTAISLLLPKLNLCGDSGQVFFFLLQAPVAKLLPIILANKVVRWLEFPVLTCQELAVCYCVIRLFPGGKACSNFHASTETQYPKFQCWLEGSESEVRSNSGPGKTDRC